MRASSGGARGTLRQEECMVLRLAAPAHPKCRPIVFTLSKRSFLLPPERNCHIARLSSAVIQGLCLLGALSTHSSAPVAIASADLYVLFRCIVGRVPRRLLFIFCAAQLVLALVLAWLYFTNPSKSSLSHVAGFSYLDSYFARPGETSLGFSKRVLI